VAFADQYGTLLSILILDIDHFKKINDTYSHSMGDEILKSLAERLRQFVRVPEIIGRYGGEEFLIVLPHYTLTSATEHAGQLCEQIRSMSVAVGVQTFAITISIGVAQYHVRTEDWQVFLNRAENALTQAKEQGRDRWVASVE